MTALRLSILACLVLTACATPENRRELTGPYYPYKPIPYTRGEVGKTRTSPNETTVWYGPDTKDKITGRWGMGGHHAVMEYPQTPPGIKQRVISRNNWKGLKAQQVANRELGLN